MIPVFIACLFACAPLDLQQAAAGPRTVQGAAASPQRGSEESARTPNAMGLQGYSVVLVVGDMQTAGAGDTVPAAARKALTDMQAFLPYKRYQLVDAGWIVCCAGFHTPVVSRMRGPDDRDYSYAIETLNGENGKLTLHFWLREGDSAPVAVSGQRAPTPIGSAMSDTARADYSRQLYEARKELSDTELQLRQTKRMHDVGTASDTDYETLRRRYQLAQTHVDELERTLGERIANASARGNVLDSVFSIAIGETVVIGTSRLRGDQALIALLTAAGKGTPAR